MTVQSEAKDAVLERFRVESITEGALRAIARKGASATMQDIADESGIAKGTLYLYFKDRDDLLGHVSDASLGQLGERIREVFDRKLPFEETIRELVATKLRFFEERRDFYRVQFELKLPHGGAHPCPPAKMPQQKKLYIDRLAKYFEETIDAGEDAQRLALFVTEAFGAVLTRTMLDTGPHDTERDAQFLSNLLLHGLTGRKKNS